MLYVKEIPCFAIDPSQFKRIHVFSNASSIAYAALVYVIQDKKALISAKSRIVPIKDMTIPRLELFSHART